MEITAITQTNRQLLITWADASRTIHYGTQADAGLALTVYRLVDAEIEHRFGKGASERLGEYISGSDIGIPSMSAEEIIEWAKDETDHMVAIARGDETRVAPSPIGPIMIEDFSDKF